MEMTAIERLQGQNNQPIEAFVQIVDLTVRDGRNGKFGLGKALDTSGITVAFTCWDEATTLEIEKKLISGALFGNLSGKTNVYNEKWQLEMASFVEVQEFDRTLFLKTPYVIEEEQKAVQQILSENVSETGRSVANTIFKAKDGLYKDFCEEFSAKSHHDNVRHGLIAHTRKMLEIGAVIARQHGNLIATQEQKDLFFIGILAHDLGKTMEMEYGVYPEDKFFFLGHRYLGAELLERVKEPIVAAYSESWFAHLLAILLQHHGQYEERPRTTMAYLVHLVDCFEAQVTDFAEKLAETEDSTMLKARFGQEFYHLTKPNF